MTGTYIGAHVNEVNHTYGSCNAVISIEVRISEIFRYGDWPAWTVGEVPNIFTDFHLSCDTEKHKNTCEIYKCMKTETTCHHFVEIKTKF